MVPDGQLKVTHRAPTWAISRHDDSGNQSLISSGHSAAEAKDRVEWSEASTHKQTCWMECDESPEALDLEIPLPIVHCSGVPKQEPKALQPEKNRLVHRERFD